MTWIEALGVHVMTYVAYGPLGPRSAVATSTDLRTWTRHGPVLFAYDDELDCDLNLFHNKDTVFFSRAGPRARTARESLAVLHRPMWDLDETRLGQGRRPPAGMPDSAGRASGSPSSRWRRSKADLGRLTGLVAAPLPGRTGVRVRGD